MESMDHLNVPTRTQEYYERPVIDVDRSGPSARSRTSTFPPRSLPRTVSLLSFTRPPCPASVILVESSSASTTTTNSSPILSSRSRATLSSEVGVFYGRIPEVLMFNLFCSADFPGVADLPISCSSLTSVNRVPPFAFTTALDHACSREVKSILVKRQQENTDIGSSDEETAPLQQSPHFEWPCNVDDYVRISQRKVRFKEFPQLTGNYKIPSPSQSLDHIADLKPTMHLASLLVQTSAYRHLRMDWEVCSEVFSLLRHHKEGIKYKTAYETLSHMGLHYVRKTSVISRENPGEIIKEISLTLCASVVPKDMLERCSYEFLHDVRLKLSASPKKWKTSPCLSFVAHQ